MQNTAYFTIAFTALLFLLPWVLRCETPPRFLCLIIVLALLGTEGLSGIPAKLIEKLLGR